MTPNLRSDVPAARPMVSMLRCLGAAALLPVLAGCPSPDAQGKYDHFLEQTEEEREDAANIKLDQGGALADVNGTFLLALAAVIDTEHPLQFYTTVTFTPGTEGGMVALELQPLSLEVLGTTKPRLPVGDVLSLPAVPVDAGGGFMITIADPVMVTGEANPITGSDIVATLALTGAIQSEDLFCGTVTGAVTSPLQLDLMGSTFAAVRVPAIDMLPEEVTSKCPEGGAGETGGSTGAGTSDGSGSDSGG